MRGRIVGAFALGFAAGVLCLALGLWASGSLAARAQHSVRSVAAAPGAPLHEPGTEKPGRIEPAPLVPPPINPPRPTASAGAGEADRGAPSGTPYSGPALAMPLEGIDTAHLGDTFHDTRDGHEHEALDIPAPRNTPVHAVAEGNVAKLFNSKQGGITVYQFDDSQTYCYYYAHLERYAAGLKEGTLLRKGDVLGYVGTTGNAPANAPHLHFAVFVLGPEKHWWQGTSIDPLPLLSKTAQ